MTTISLWLALRLNHCALSRSSCRNKFLQIAASAIVAKRLVKPLRVGPSAAPKHRPIHRQEKRVAAHPKVSGSHCRLPIHTEQSGRIFQQSFKVGADSELGIRNGRTPWEVRYCAPSPPGGLGREPRAKSTNATSKQRWDEGRMMNAEAPDKAPGDRLRLPLTAASAFLPLLPQSGCPPSGPRCRRPAPGCRSRGGWRSPRREYRWPVPR